MRTLYLRWPRDVGPSAAESLLLFSPRVHYRAPGHAFVDIASTAKLFGGDARVLACALDIAREFDPDATGAVADAPWAAQALATHRPNAIGLPRRDVDELAEAPLEILAEFEGLTPWRKPAAMKKVTEFFKTLGLRHFGELRRFGVEAFRERWGEAGELIWMRLRGVDEQVISPLLPTESLEEFKHLDFPVGSLDLLLGHLDGALKRLLVRLRGRGEFATVVTTKLYCEYSGKIHVHELRPATPGRDHALITKLLENKLARINLDNPVHQIAIAVTTTPERVQQLSFFEPRVSDLDKLDQLVSVFGQASIHTGFFEIRDEILPERTWALAPKYTAPAPVDDVVETRARSFQIRPAYSRGLLRAPRPSRLLRKPRALPRTEFDGYQLLSQRPIERLEDGWWDELEGRDYYFARSPRGEFVWLYFDRADRTYYVHGYFD